MTNESLQPAAANVAVATISPEVEAAQNAEARMLAVRELIIGDDNPLGIRDTFTRSQREARPEDSRIGQSPAIYIDRVGYHGHNWAGDDSEQDISAFRPDTVIPAYEGPEKPLAYADAMIQFSDHTTRKRGTDELGVHLIRRNEEGEPTHAESAFKVSKGNGEFGYLYCVSDLNGDTGHGGDPNEADPEAYARVVSEATEVIKVAALARTVAAQAEFAKGVFADPDKLAAAQAAAATLETL